MGIRGLTTLLNQDRKRFGYPWSSTSSTTATIYIDGPSLLYHLLSQPPVPTFNSLPPSFIFTLAHSFLTQMQTAGLHNIYVIMDGVSPKQKLSSDLQRMENKTQSICEGGCVSQKLPHLFAEWGIRQACQSLQIPFEIGDAEAEHEIAHRILFSNDDNVVIFSNDSDFMVYESCPGFVSFHSLVFQVEEIHGWFLSRDRFVKAMNLRTDVMPAIAALVGCDYVSDESQNQLIGAKRIICRSHIGGLRQREKNNPSVKGIVMAVLRFVSYCGNKSGGDWMTRLCWESVGKGKEQKERSEKLKMAIREFYDLYDVATDRNENRPYRNAQVRRILEQKMFFCHPVMQMWKNPKKIRRNYPNANNMGGSSIWMSSSFVEFRTRLYTFLNEMDCNHPLALGVTEYYCQGKHPLQVQSNVIQPVNLNEFFISQPTIDASFEHLLFNSKEQSIIETFVSQQIPSKLQFIFLTGLLLLPNSKVSTLLFSIMSTAFHSPHDKKDLLPPLQHHLSIIQVACYHTLLSLQSLLSQYSSSNVFFQTILNSFSPCQIFSNECASLCWEVIQDDMIFEEEFWETSMEVNGKRLLEEMCRRDREGWKTFDNWHESITILWDNWSRWSLVKSNEARLKCESGCTGE